MEPRRQGRDSAPSKHRFEHVYETKLFVNVEALGWRGGTSPPPPSLACGKRAEYHTPSVYDKGNAGVGDRSIDRS